jgi:hypothetical protein
MLWSSTLVLSTYPSRIIGIDIEQSKKKLEKFKFWFLLWPYFIIRKGLSIFFSCRNLVYCSFGLAFFLLRSVNVSDLHMLILSISFILSETNASIDQHSFLDTEVLSSLCKDLFFWNIAFFKDLFFNVLNT